MEGVDPEGVDLMLAGHALPDLDRRALASHCAAVAQHMTAIARIFDPLCSKAAPDSRKHKKAIAGALAAPAAHRGTPALLRCGRADVMRVAANRRRRRGQGAQAEA